MNNQKFNIFILITILVMIVVGIYYIYSDLDYKNKQRLILEQDSIKTLEFNNKIKTLDSLDRLLLKQDSLQNTQINVLKKNYKKRKESIDNTRNTLPVLPIF